MKDQDSKDKVSELRRRAELAAAEKSSSGISDVSALSPEKVQQLIHELQVHQIELEIQNEELRQEFEASRDKYSKLYDVAPVGYFTLDHKGVILEANLTVCGLLGRARAFLIGKPLASLVNEEDANALYLHFRQVLETQSKQTCDVRLAKNDGSHIPVRLDSQVLESQDGSPTVLRTVLTAITSRKRAEEALYASESRYRRLFDSVRYGILMVDFDTGKILDVNQYLIDMLGYSHEEFLEKCLWEVSPFKDTALNKDAFAELQQKGYVRYEDLPLETSDGRSIDVEVVSNSHLVSGLTFVQCNIRDITDRRRAEETTSRLAAIVESSDDAIIGKTLNGSIVSWNGGAAKLYGYRAEEVVGQPISILISPEQFDDLPDILTRIRRGEAVSHFETKRRTKDGRIVDVSLSVSPIKTQAGQIVGASTIARDMTDPKRVEEALLASEEK